MANRTLEVRLVRVTGGVTTVLGKVLGGSIQLSNQAVETPGAGTHVYKLQIRDNSGLYTGNVNGRSLVAFRAQR